MVDPNSYLCHFCPVRLNSDCTEEAYMVCISNWPFFCVDLKRPSLEQAHPLPYPHNRLLLWINSRYFVGKFAARVARSPSIDVFAILCRKWMQSSIFLHVNESLLDVNVVAIYRKDLAIIDELSGLFMLVLVVVYFNWF